MTNDYQIDIYSELSSLPVPSFLPRPVRELRKQPKPKRVRVFLFQTQDTFGKTWNVEQVRPTHHGFDVLYGQKEGLPGSIPRLICTTELREFWDAHKATYDAATYDLPMGRTTIKRARKKLGFNRGKDLSKFWMDRIHDLKTMTPREFAAKHNLTVSMAFDARARLLGRSARQLGWWKTPSIVQFLRSGVICREIKEKLGVSLTHAHRLRKRACQGE
jgi:hypothetical protein